MSNLNPFNPNSVVAPNLFAGRSSQLLEICKKLSQLRFNMPSSFFIYGERGIGKTALAKLIRFIATEKDDILYNLNLITSYYAVEGGQELASVLQESLNKLTDEMDKSLVEKIGSRLGGIFKNGKFQIGAFGASIDIETKESELKKEITIKDQTVSILSNIVKSLNEDETTQIKDGILIVIDEIHHLKDMDKAASIIRNIVTTLDVENLGKISFLLIGYEEDLEKFFSKDSSSRRTFDLFKLNIMPDSEASEILSKGFTSVAITWDEKSLSESIKVAGGYPHSIQMIGHNLVKVDSDKHIDNNDWQKAIFTTALELQSKAFANLYSFNKPLTIKDQILVLLANENKPLSKKDIADKLQKNIYQYIPELKTKGAIKEDSEDKIILQSQLFRTSILMDQSIRQLKE